MLSFKQFITETTIQDFNHLGLDSNNPEHQELVDAYNHGKSRAFNDLPKHDNQIKKEIPTIDHLKTLLQPHLTSLRQKRQYDQEDEEAFRNKDVELIHHNPENGLKVFRVKNQKGSCAVSSSGAKGAEGEYATWCTSDRGKDDFSKYDPEGNNSFVLHLPKEKGNLRKIGIFGIKPFEPSKRGKIQDKGNVYVTDDDWNRIKNEYQLDKIPELLNIRNIGK